MSSNFSSVLLIIYFATAPVCSLMSKDTAICIPTMQNKLGPVFEILAHPKSVKRFKTVSLGPNGYSVVGKEADLSPEDLRSLQAVVLKEKSYDWFEIKSCLFMPETGLRFSREGKEVVVLFSPSGNQLKIIFNEHSLLLDYEPVQEIINKIIK